MINFLLSILFLIITIFALAFIYTLLHGGSPTPGDMGLMLASIVFLRYTEDRLNRK